MIKSSCSEFFLRPIEISDLPQVQDWRNSEYLRRFFREYRELSAKQIEDWYYAMLSDPKFEMFIICDISGTSLGVAGLTYIDFVNRHADVHFYIGKDEQWIDDYVAHRIFPALINYGFNIMNLNKLWAEIYEIDSLKSDFFRKFGFTCDAVLREHYFYDGAYVSSCIYSLLKNEYKL